MIQSIDIENFRCFEKTEISGFQRMNLITGKNNSGKTALLEALYLSLTEDIESIKSNSRKSADDKDNLENIFFEKQDMVIIETQIYNNIYEFKLDKMGKKEIYSVRIDKETNLREYDSGRVHSEESLLSQDTRFILDKTFQIPNYNIIERFDGISVDGNETIIEDALKAIDSNITGMRTYSTKPNILFLRTLNQSAWQPIFYFGDAIQKIVRYIINILDIAKSEKYLKILLIDEIENGLHYTAQEEFWRMLFKLCIEFDVQLFATTHSLEMIKAYQRVATEFENQAAYFEMARHAKTNQIIGIKHDMDVLEYELVANETIRGE